MGLKYYYLLVSVLLKLYWVPGSHCKILDTIFHGGVGAYFQIQWFSPQKRLGTCDLVHLAPRNVKIRFEFQIYPWVEKVSYYYLYTRRGAFNR
jgi:hypothetical protein